MSNPVVTNIDYGHFLWRDEQWEDHVLTFAGATTYSKGTVLARDTSTLKWVPYVVGGVTNGNGTPRGVLMADVTATGAGDMPCRVVIKGTVNRKRLIVAAAGDDSTITKLIEDMLRAYMICPISAAQLSA